MTYVILQNNSNKISIIHDGAAYENLVQLNEAKTRIDYKLLQRPCQAMQSSEKHNLQNHLYKNAFQAMLCFPDEYQFLII